MTTPLDSSPSDDRLPSWLAEALDVLTARRRIVVATAIGLVLLGAIVALLLPGVLPPRPIVGAAVGIAAALLATALALAMDASDLVVRGTRHVRAAGGTVDVRVSRQADDVGPLLAAVARHASDGQVRVALSAASRKAGVPGVRAAALAEALARTGRKVLLTDLTRGGSPAAGLSDVIAGTRTLPEVVRFEQDLYLARLAVGSDPDVALDGFAGWVDGLPSDLEVLVVALPPLAERGVVKAAASLDCTLVLVEVDRTERVDLIASLDAVDAAGLTSELVLVDPQHADAAPTTGVGEASDADAEPDEDGPVDGADPSADDADEVPAADAPAADAQAADAREDDEPAVEEPTATDSRPEEVAPASAASEAVEPEVVAPPVHADADVDPGPQDDDDEEEDLLAAIGLTDDAFDTGEVPVADAPATDPATDPTTTRGTDADADGDGGVGPDDLDDGDSAARDDDRGSSGEVAALLGGAAAGAAGAGVVGAATSAGGGVGGSGAPDDDDRPGDATAEIAMPGRTEDDRPAGDSDDAAGEAADDEPEEDRLTQIWDDPAAHDAPPAPEPAIDRDVDEPEPEVVDEQDVLTGPSAPEPASASLASAAATAPSPSPPSSSPQVSQPSAVSQPAGPGEVGLDPAALEVARTSAALHQLAQQIWDRDPS